MIHLSSLYIYIPFWRCETLYTCVMSTYLHMYMYIFGQDAWLTCVWLFETRGISYTYTDAFEFLGLNICFVFWPKEPHIKWTICSTIISVLVTEKAANLVTKLLNWVTFKYLSLRTCLSTCIIFVLFSWTTLKIFIAAKRIHTIIKMSTEQTLNITNNFLSNNFFSLSLSLCHGPAPPCPTSPKHILPIPNIRTYI
jgi:hypothetical protein